MFEEWEMDAVKGVGWGLKTLGRHYPDLVADWLAQQVVHRRRCHRALMLRKATTYLSDERGDWQQPAEDRYRLSRGMLEVVRDLGFPLFIVERSPLLTRDLDLLVDINRQAWVGVTFSMSSVDPALKQAFEPRSPGVKRRLQAMEQLASAGILVGTSLMPIFPFVGDDKGRLEDAVRATKEHGGSFVLAGSLTMDGVQAERTLEAARRFDPALEARFRQLYDWKPGGNPNHSPPRAYKARLGLLVRELCTRHGLLDRLPRYIAPGPLAVNKRIAERLFLKTYDLETASPIITAPARVAASANTSSPCCSPECMSRTSSMS